MKKILSILLLVSMLTICLISCNSKSYKNAFELIDIGEYHAAYEVFCELGNYKDSQKEVTKFHYLPTKIVVEEEIDGVKENRGTITVSFNEQNLPSQAIASTDDGENAILNFTYDENGNLIKRVNTDPDGDKSIYDYTYDEENNLIKAVYTDSDGDKSIYDYTFDENGNLIKKVYTSYAGKKSVYDYTYDENGNLIKEVYTYSLAF